MIVIYKGSLTLIKKYYILDFNINMFEKFINDLNDNNIKT
jgi:hypothetical protein